MGNLQCAGVDHVDDRLLQLQSTAEDSLEASLFDAMDQQTRAERAFLRVHKEDRAQKVLLETREVAKALVEQAEELLRRENAAKLVATVQEDPLTDSEDTHDEQSLCDGTSTFNNSILSATVMTSVSAATRVAKNLDPDAPKKPKKELRPQIKGDKKAFLIHQNFQEEIRSVLSMATRKNLGKQYGRRKRNTSSEIVRISDYEGPCGVLTCLEDTEKIERINKVREHMAILYLKMPLHCATYFQRNLARLMPDNPISQAIATGMSSPNFSTPSGHGLVPSTSDSSSSAGEIQFGAGPPSKPIHALVTGDTFLDLALTGSLGMVQRRTKKTIIQSNQKQIKSLDHFVVLLHRRSGVPLAICALKSKHGPPIVRVFATKRRVYGQTPASTTHKLGLTWSKNSLPLYSWAEFVTEGQYPNPVTYSIYVATGSDGRFEEAASYRAVHESAGSPEIRVVGRTEREDNLAGAAVLSMAKDRDAFDDDEVYFRLSISKGIDPALMICFAAFVDEAMEKMMRIECQKLKESVYRMNRP